MNTDLDERIAALLKADAPAERDPVFRIKVLERRERQRFHRRSFAMVIAALALMMIALVGYSAGARVAEAASIALLCISIAAALVFTPVVTRSLRRSWRKNNH